MFFLVAEKPPKFKKTAIFLASLTAFASVNPIFSLTIFGNVLLICL